MSAQAAHRVKVLVDELLAIRLADLGDRDHATQRLTELSACLDEVSRFAGSLQNIVGSLSGRANRSAGRAPKPMVARRRGTRGPGEFNATPFILESVRRSDAAGIRPREIVEQIQQAAPGRHVRPSALVSTILTRLKRRGDVRRRAGKWFAV